MNVDGAVTLARIWGHRGLAVEPGVVQNTARSVNAAIDAGADGFESDFWRTLDQRLAVHHGPIIGSTLIATTKLEDLPRLADGSRPPTAEDLLSNLHTRPPLPDGTDPGPLDFDLEKKDPRRASEDVDLVQTVAPHYDLTVTSFLGSAIRAARFQHPSLRTGLIVSAYGFGRVRSRFVHDTHFGRAERAGANLLVANRSMVTDEFLGRAEHFGMPLVVWTVNDTREMAHFLQIPQVHAIITDRADLAVDVRKRLIAGGRGTGS